MKIPTDSKALDSSSLKIISVENWDDWDSAVQQSAQGSIFIHSSYLKMSRLSDFARFLILDGKIVGGIVIPELLSVGSEDFIRDFATYQSLWLLRPSSVGFRSEQKNKELLLKLGELLLTNRANFSLSLHWSISDIRVLDWAYFNQEKSIRFTPRYSGLLNFSDFSNFQEYLNSISSGRKSDWKLADVLKIEKTTSTTNLDQFIELYKETVPFSDVSKQYISMQNVRKIIQDSISAGTGTLWSARNSEGNLLSGVFIQEFDGHLYYQFGVNSPKRMNFSPNAILLLNVIKESFTKGYKSLDFVGINSPNRGAFKESFNPKAKLYFQVDVN